MERTYSRSQCGGPRAAMPAKAPPGPGNLKKKCGQMKITYSSHQPVIKEETEVI